MNPRVIVVSSIYALFDGLARLLVWERMNAPHAAMIVGGIFLDFSPKSEQLLLPRFCFLEILKHAFQLPFHGSQIMTQTEIVSKKPSCSQQSSPANPFAGNQTHICQLPQMTVGMMAPYISDLRL